MCSQSRTNAPLVNLILQASRTPLICTRLWRLHSIHTMCFSTRGFSSEMVKRCSWPQLEHLNRIPPSLFVEISRSPLLVLVCSMYSMVIGPTAQTKRSDHETPTNSPNRSSMRRPGRLRLSPTRMSRRRIRPRSSWADFAARRVARRGLRSCRSNSAKRLHDPLPKHCGPTSGASSYLALISSGFSYSEPCSSNSSNDFGFSLMSSRSRLPHAGGDVRPCSQFCTVDGPTPINRAKTA